MGIASIPSRSRETTWIVCRYGCSLGLIQSAFPHLIAENLLRYFSQIAEVRSQFAQFVVTLLAVEFPEPSPMLRRVVPHEEQYSAGLKPVTPLVNEFLKTYLAKGTPTDVSEHGPADDQKRDRERRDNAGPEADAAEGNEKGVLMTGKRDSRLVRQESANSYREEKPPGPNNGESERKLKGLIHGNCPLWQRATE